MPRIGPRLPARPAPTVPLAGLLWLLAAAGPLAAADPLPATRPRVGIARVVPAQSAKGVARLAPPVEMPDAYAASGRAGGVSPPVLSSAGHAFQPGGLRPPLAQVEVTAPDDAPPLYRPVETEPLLAESGPGWMGPAVVPPPPGFEIPPPPLPPSVCVQTACELPRRMTFSDDLYDFVPRLWDDAIGLARCRNVTVLGAALGGAIGLRQGPDQQVRANTARHPTRWGGVSQTLGHMGEVQYQVPVLLGVYGWSLYRQDEELHDFTGTLISAYTLSGLATVLIKGAANTDRPSMEWNNGHFGFPSYHTASSFTVAAVVEEYYGPQAGIPLYALAGLIGWSRIDERDHDLSDVVFGAALGYVIGKSVARRHLEGDSRIRFGPYLHPTGAGQGVMVDYSF